MKRPEYSVGAAIMAVLALALMAVAFTATWFEYDYSTGRKTAPGGAYQMEGNGVERASLDFYADRWNGDVEPSDSALAEQALTVMTWGIYIAAGALLLVALAEIPGIARFARRRLSLALVAIALVAVTAAAWLAWTWLPESMAGHGVDSQFTARLDEPDEYTHTTMGLGWYAMALSILFVTAAGMFKFQAGHIDPDDVTIHLREAESA